MMDIRFWLIKTLWVPQLVLVTLVTFFLGVVYGGFSISDGTAWVFPINYLSLGTYWEPLGWWDSTFVEAVIFFEIIMAPLFAALFGSMLKMRGSIGLSYIGSIVGGMLQVTFFMLALAIPTMWGVDSWLAYLGVVATSLGAVLGYHAIRRRRI